MRRFELAVLVILLATPTVAEAYEVESHSGPVVAPAAPTGMAGAYTALSEGASGLTFNPAAIASRSGTQSQRFAGDFALDVYNPGLKVSLLVKSFSIPVGGRNTFDPSQRDTSASAEAVAGSVLFARTGWGAILLHNGYSSHSSTLATYAVGGVVGHGFMDGQFAVGIEGTKTFATLSNARADGSYEIDYFDGYSARVGAIARPRGRSFRLGASFRPESMLRVLMPVSEWETDSIHIPWQASIGFARALDDRDFNLPGWTLSGGSASAGERRSVIISSDIVIVGPSGDAATFESVPGQDPERLGARITLSPRIGAESELIPGRFRARAGTYLEPARAGGRDRVHGTAGYDLKLGKLGPTWKMTASVDVADEYQSMSVSLGLWK